MLCDTCIKISVCKYKEECNRLERQLIGNSMNDIFAIRVSCKEYNTQKPNVFRESFSSIAAD